MNKFNFWCPVEIKKAIDPVTGEQIMRLGGIASSIDKDYDGEILDVNGFNLKPLIEKGVVNWHHQAKNKPATIIGEPHLVEIRGNDLYVETDLYPSSELANEVYSLANTFSQDSKTRRLGYSIEGTVIKRKSDDKNNPDYKKVEKAIITGLAITHQPKNPKSLIDIIKGNYEEENLIEDKIDNDCGKDNPANIIKKSLSKIDTFTKIFEKANIGIKKAKKIYTLISNISDMNKMEITDDQIEKAFEILNIVKSIPEETETKETETKETETKESESDEEDDEEEDGEEEKKETKKKKPKKKEDEEIEKSIVTEDEEKTENIFEKSILESLRTQEMVKSTGILMKGILERLNSSNEEIDSLKEIIKSQSNDLNDINENVNKISEYTPGSRSLRYSNPIEREFGNRNQDLTKGIEDSNVIHISHKANILNILDEMSFEKGFDQEMSQACLNFEATGNLDDGIISKIKTVKNITIIKG